MENSHYDFEMNKQKNYTLLPLTFRVPRKHDGSTGREFPLFRQVEARRLNFHM